MDTTKIESMQRDYEISLHAEIHHAEGIDNPTDYPSVTERLYKAIFWVHPDEQYRTRLVQGLPNPVWNKGFKLGIDKSADNRFLYVEVIRYGSMCDPGTSNGNVFVGRAGIPLPDLSSKEGGRYGLVRPEGDRYKAEGHISISMEWKKFLVH